MVDSMARKDNIRIYGDFFKNKFLCQDVKKLFKKTNELDKQGPAA